MTDAKRWTTLTADEVRAHAGAEVRQDAQLSEAAAREALAIRHPSVNPGVIGLICQIVEAAMLTLAVWGASRAWPPMAAETPLATLTLSLIGAVGVSLLAMALGGYRIDALSRFAVGFPRAAAAAAAGALGVVVGVWVTDAQADGLIFVATAALATLFTVRLLMTPTVAWCVSAGLTERRAVVVGGGGNAERLIRGLEGQSNNDIRIVGVFDDRADDRSPPLVAGARKLGGVAELVEFARIAHIDMLIVTLPLSAEKRILSLLKALWVLPVDIRLSAYAADFEFPRREAMIDVLRRPLDDWRRGAKRVMDVTVAAVALVALSPVMLATALAVRLTSRGPALFKQTRHGYNHQPVEVWKFRSMRHEQADPTARKVVTRDDPRVTPVGRFIRKTSIDELPQLFNVLRGDLSLVGPRPHALNAISSRAQTFTEIVDGYSGRHRMPPGITGWAQVNGWRGEIDDPESLRQRFEHDLFYIENWSLAFDLYILFLTPLRLFTSRNAY